MKTPPYGTVTNWLSGKKFRESRDFLAMLGVFERRHRAFFVWPQPVNHHLDGADLHPPFTMLCFIFRIPTQPPTTSQPSKRPLHHPTDLHRLEHRRVRRATANLKAVSNFLLLHPCLQLAVVVLVVSKDNLQTRKV